MDEPNDIIADENEEAVREGPGPHVIRAHLKTLPNRPGVYRMFDTKGDVLYVGKARSLKNRVASYIRLGGHSPRAQLPPDCMSRVPRMLDGSLRRQAVGSRLDQHP